MAGSQINIECKRFGCVKNLLACYANCRYNTRCDELRNEIGDRLETATSDINAYLTERGRPPILIQLAKRGLRFNAAPARPAPAPKPELKALTAARPVTAPKPAKIRRLQAELSAVPQAVPAAPKAKVAQPEDSPRPLKKRRRRAARRPAPEKIRKILESGSTGGPMPADNERQPSPSQVEEKSSRKKAGKSDAPRRAARKGRPAKKQYIILNGKSATLVDEKGLLAHLLSGQAQETRIFEAIEVEARLQIAPIR